MKTPARKRYTLLASVLLIGGCALACFLWVKHEQRQYRMNRQLIEALHQGDFKRALALVEQGADPNARFIPVPPPTWKELLNQLVKHSASSSNNSPTAFMLVCGAIDPQTEHHFNAILSKDPMRDSHMMQLATVMVAHRANVNAIDERGTTALMWASRLGYTDRMALLLKHGALTDSLNKREYNALLFAIIDNNVESVKLLLTYHENPNLKIFAGMTPLYMASQFHTSPEIIRLLKAAGTKK